MSERPTEVRALLFDLDGTIVDTGELHYRASVETLVKFGISIERDTYDSVIHGNSNENIARYFFPDGDAVKQARYVEMKECAFRASLILLINSVWRIRLETSYPLSRTMHS